MTTPTQTKWDRRFLDLARLVSSWSKDPSTKTGAVITRPDKTVASIGFNGFPQSMPDLPDWYENREEKYSRIVHCEINALIFAKEPVIGYTVYIWPFLCCDRCCVTLIQSGIKRFVAPIPSADALTRWSGTFERTRKYCAQTSVVISEIEL